MTGAPMQFIIDELLSKMRKISEERANVFRLVCAREIQGDQASLDRLDYDGDLVRLAEALGSIAKAARDGGHW